MEADEKTMLARNLETIALASIAATAFVAVATLLGNSLYAAFTVGMFAR